MATAPSTYQYNALIIDSDVQSRMRLKQATASVGEFGDVEQIGAIRDGLQRLGGEKRCDVVFLSHNFSIEETTHFIREAKKLKQGQDSAYVLVLRGKDQESASVATSVMQGADGILFEPYSVEILVELTKLAARIRKERSDARERVALNLMLTEIMNQLDLVAFLKSCGLETVRSQRKFAELCEVIRKMEPEKIALYHDVAISTFAAAPLPKKAFQVKRYKGASDRVRKIMEKKILEELERDRTENSSNE